MVEDVSYTCETAAHFWLLHVLSRWEKFVIEVERRRTPESVQVCESVGLFIARTWPDVGAQE